MEWLMTTPSWLSKFQWMNRPKPRSRNHSRRSGLLPSWAKAEERKSARIAAHARTGRIRLFYPAEKSRVNTSGEYLDTTALDLRNWLKASLRAGHGRASRCVGELMCRADLFHFRLPHSPRKASMPNNLDGSTPNNF